MAKQHSFPLVPISETPLVSCIMIFLNEENFLAEAIDSVLTQTYKNWELLLVDDGSTDNSTQIAQKCAQTHAQKVCYLEHLNHGNQGKNASRNLGIRQARGELVALLDSDDIWLPDKLTEQVAVFQKYPEVGMVYGRSQFWYSWTNSSNVQQLDRHWSGTEPKTDVSGSKQRDHFVQLAVPPDTLVQPPALALSILQGGSQTPTPCNAMLRHEVFDMIGGFDESYVDILEDQAFFIKVELYFPVFVADSWWARYRQHPASSMTQFAMTARQDSALIYSTWIKFFRWVEAYLISQRYYDAEIWLCLRQQQNFFQRKLWLDRALNYGRQVLPQSWRTGLWQAFGKHLYGDG